MKTLLVSVALVVAACGSSAGPTGGPGQPTLSPGASPTVTPAPASPGPVVSPTPAPSLEPTPAAMTVEEAAEAYLAIAKTYNGRIAKINDRFGGRTALKAHRKYWAAAAEAEQAFADAIKELEWPAEVSREIDSLVRAVVVAERRFRVAAKSTSFAELYPAARDAERAITKAADAAALVRDALGLPSN